MPSRSSGVEERAEQERLRAEWFDMKHMIERTPREHAEATWTSEFWGSVDDLENEIRWAWGRPQFDHDTGLERGDLHRDAEERARDEWQALDWAREGYPGNPAGLSWEEYLRMWREIAGLTASTPVSLEETLDRIRARRGLVPIYGHEFTHEELQYPHRRRGGETT